MANAIKSSDIPAHQAKKEKAQKRKKSKKQRDEVAVSFADKTFAELKNKDKDDLLKAIALELGLIAPD